MNAILDCGTCRIHGKVLFPSRKMARMCARRVHPGQGLSAYECDTTPGLWHLGHLPSVVVRGVAARSTLSTGHATSPR